MRTYVRLTVCLALIFASFACTKRQRIIPGRYVTMGYRMTDEARNDSIEFVSRGPVFEFRADGRTVAISNDFTFGCFQDSLYEYTYSEGILHLRGQNISKDFFCEPSADSGYKMFLDEKYVQLLIVVRNDN